MYEDAAAQGRNEATLARLLLVGFHPLSPQGKQGTNTPNGILHTLPVMYTKTPELHDVQVSANTDVKTTKNRPGS